MRTPATAAPRTWFITGAGRGLGRAFALAALERGDRVAAAARTVTMEDFPSQYADRLLVLPLDVTDRAAALRYTREKDAVTTGVLYEVRQPSLVERMDEVRNRAREVGEVTSTAGILAAFAPPL